MRRTMHRLSVTLRGRVCVNADGQCQACGQPCPDGVVHHRKQRSLGGTDDPTNLAWLHPLCHAAVHDNVSRSHDLGLLVHSWDDPASIPVLPPFTAWEPYPAADEGARTGGDSE
jgi:hypothetical protein